VTQQIHPHLAELIVNELVRKRLLNGSITMKIRHLQFDPLLMETGFKIHFILAFVEDLFSAK